MTGRKAGLERNKTGQLSVADSMARLILAFLAAISVAAPQDLASRLDRHVQAYVDQQWFNGSVLVARDGKPVLSKGYGMANFEWNVPNNPQTKFRLGSITKQFTAMLVLQLEQQGKLKVHDPIAKYMPDAPPAWQKITFHHLLTHSAGLPNFTSFPDYLRTMNEPSPPAETLQRFRDKELEFEPGARFNYSNSGYVLLGYLLEKITGKSYEQVLREQILTPLGMEDTGYDMPAPVLKNRASGYRLGPKGYMNAAFIDMTIPHAAGAMYSTVEDLLKWDQALYTEQLLPKAALDRMFEPFKDNYAYGWVVGDHKGRTRMAHGGGINGFATFIARYPNERLTVITLANLENAQSGKLAEELALIAFGETVEPPRQRTAIHLDPKILDAYAGSYQLRPDFILRFWREGDQFMVQATGQPAVQVFAESETQFFLKVVDAQITFFKNEAGQVTHLMLHQGGRDVKGERLP